VILLQGDDRHHALWQEILDQLAGCFRVIIPESLPDEADLPDWLRTFLDGLGTDRVSLVVGGRFGIAALHFALLDTDSVERVVVLTPSEHEAGGTVGDSLQPESHPLLLLPVEGPCEIVAARVVTFLCGGAPAAS
jgi:pimeloyl-ACP methyl ester carboxylesterase